MDVTVLTYFFSQSLMSNFVSTWRVCLWGFLRKRSALESIVWTKRLLSQWGWASSNLLKAEERSKRWKKGTFTHALPSYIDTPKARLTPMAPWFSGLPIWIELYPQLSWFPRLQMAYYGTSWPPKHLSKYPFKKKHPHQLVVIENSHRNVKHNMGLQTIVSQ